MHFRQTKPFQLRQRILMLMALAFFSSSAVKLQAQGTATIVNGASFRAEQPMAPGSWVSAFGAFSNVGQVQNTVIPLPTTLGGVSISVDGTAAPINYVSGTQINFLIPGQVQSGTRPVAITTPGGTVNGSVRIIANAPGIFKKDTATPPLGAILNQDSSENAESRPAIRGQAISIYATGQGELNTAVSDGGAAPSNPPATSTTLPQVFIGGVEVPVEFSGLAPGFAGLWQINVRLPNQSFLAGRLPLVVYMNGVDSNEVALYVAQ
jgi:uncharacterized protein (TIGR03437 family)